MTRAGRFYKQVAPTELGHLARGLLHAGRGDCRLETSGGGITVSLPASAAVDLDAKTSGGSVKSDFAVSTSDEKSRSSLRGKINSGGKALQLRTSGGSIHVKKA